MSSALENEDLENVPLVRMEDVQPSRNRIDRTVEVLSPSVDDEEVYETCIIDDVVYQNDCGIDDDTDSNIGSMVSIQSEEVPEEDEDSSSAEFIVPEVLDPPVEINIPMKIKQTKIEVKPKDSWPTLEILPGGVIKNSVDSESEPLATTQNTSQGQGEMMYACAKCSQTFKYLYCLVKHVKWHEDQKKFNVNPNLKKLSPPEKELISIKRESNKLEQTYKKQKVEVFARIATAIGKINDVKELFNK